MSKSSVAETALKKLRRVESNMTCPNCGTAAPMGIGFGSVCIKFKTFVCDLCKTSHQAISHRVKSITMSNWTIEEVRELSSQQFGGNEACLHTWLGNAPKCGAKYPGGTRPKEGDKIEFFKQFVIDCYENGKFRSSSPYVPSGNDASAFAVEPKKQPVKVESGMKLKNPSADNLSGKFKAAVQVNDLMDSSDGFDQFQTTSGGASPFDPFGGGAQQAARGSSSFDEFGTSSGHPSPVPQFQQDPFSVPVPVSNSFGGSQSFGAFNSAPAPPVAPVNNSGFNSRSANSDFGGLLSATSVPVIPAAAHDPFGSSDVLLLQPVKNSAPIQQQPAFGGSNSIAPSTNSSGFGGGSGFNSGFSGMSASGTSAPTAVIGGKVSVMLPPPAASMGGMRMGNGMPPTGPPNNGGGGFGGNNNFNNNNNNGGGGMAFSGLGNPNSFGAPTTNNNDNNIMSSGLTGTGNGVMGGGNGNARAPPVSSMGGGFRPQGTSGLAPSAGGKPSGLTGALAISNLADFNLGVLIPNNPTKTSNNARTTPATSSFDFLQSTMQHHLKTSGVPQSAPVTPTPSYSSSASLQSMSVKSANSQPVMLNNQHLNYNGGLPHSASAPGGMNAMGQQGGFNGQQQSGGGNSFAGLGNVSGGGMGGGGGMNGGNGNRGVPMGGAPMGGGMGGAPMGGFPGAMGGGGGNMSAMGGGNNNQFRGSNPNPPSNPFKM